MRCERCKRFISPDTCLEGWEGGIFGDYNGRYYCAWGKGCNHQPEDESGLALLQQSLKEAAVKAPAS
jgi:hypothetical protein